MRRFVLICIGLLVASLLGGAILESAAQSVAVKTEWMSPGRRSSGPPKYKAPPGPYYIATGLSVVPVGMKAYFSADTTGSGASVVTSYSWTIASQPSGSTAVIDTPSNPFVSFIPDSTGWYIVQVSVNGGASASDTVFASTYQGTTLSLSPTIGCGMCHFSKYTTWKQTPHANIYAEGITGQLEVNPLTAKGAYATGCPKCHTTGWEPTANNGNFGYLAHQTGWDTTWYQGYTLAGGDYEIPYQDSTSINLMNAQYPSVAATASIGCESCHGPGRDHLGDVTKIGRSLSAGVCLQCHDAPSHHIVGTTWLTSDHMSMSKGHVGGTTCYPCHSGSAFVKWLDNKSSPGWSTAEDGMFPITCSVCHDPHGNSNPNELRTVSFDSLNNGYVPAAGDGGKGQLCMNCHRSRYNVAKKVTNKGPYYGFADHYGPHGNPQADMFFGQNAYQYGDPNLTGLRTHASVEDACVTCHMANGLHSWKMEDTTGGLHDVTTACQSCHGPITSFDDIKAAYDYDGNGVIEGVQTEVQGLLAKLKARLPIDVTTGEPTTALKDSLLVKNHPEYVQGIYDYYFVVNDGSFGVHNTKYAVALLQKALGYYPLDVKSGKQLPTSFALEQNYPNPFNPSTIITFALPKESSVKLEVYDMLGKHVTTLVDQEMGAGTYAITWNGSDQNGSKVASGLYLYRIQAGSFVAAKKMVLLK